MFVEPQNHTGCVLKEVSGEAQHESRHSLLAKAERRLREWAPGSFFRIRGRMFAARLMRRRIFLVLLAVLPPHTLKADKQRNAGAQNNLGLMYYKGEGVEQDYGKAGTCF